MEWKAIVTSVGALVAAVGGTGALIIALSGWLGRVWATRLSQAERARLDAEVERLRAVLQRDTSAEIDALTRRRVVYAELASSLRVLLSSTARADENQKAALLKAYDVGCLWASEQVAEAVGDLLDLVRTERAGAIAPEQARAAYQQCITAMRRDCGFPDTRFVYRVVSF